MQSETYIHTKTDKYMIKSEIDQTYIQKDRYTQTERVEGDRHTQRKTGKDSHSE